MPAECRVCRIGYWMAAAGSQDMALRSQWHNNHERRVPLVQEDDGYGTGIRTKWNIIQDREDDALERGLTSNHLYYE
jgi:hypothetical protein